MSGRYASYWNAFLILVWQINLNQPSQISVSLTQVKKKLTSVKRHVMWQGPIGMHCDVPKWVPDPFPSVMASVKTSKLPLDVWRSVCLYPSCFLLVIVAKTRFHQRGHYNSSKKLPGKFDRNKCIVFAFIKAYRRKRQAYADNHGISDILRFIHTEWKRMRKRIFLWSMSLLKVRIELDSLWTHLEAISLSLSF